MPTRHPLLALGGRAVVPTLALAVIAYFAFHAVAGGTGVTAWSRYKADGARLEREAAGVAAERALLERKIALLDPRAVDPDYADELVRESLGVIRPDEVVVPLADGTPS